MNDTSKATVTPSLPPPATGGESVSVRSDDELSLESYSFDLPESLIAQKAVEPRDAARLLVYTKADNTIRHCHVYDLPELLQPGDLLIRNSSKVIPARIFFHGSGGGKIEILLAEPIGAPSQPGYAKAFDNPGASKWLVLAKPSRKLRPGDTFPLPGGARLDVLDTAKRGERIVTITPPTGVTFLNWLEKNGEIPLPPYIERKATENDRTRYQTVFAKQAGSVAAPTAGLHFTADLIQKLRERGIEFADITLHVGLGTFQPVRAESIEQHRIQPEWLEISPEVVSQIEEAKKRNGRIIAVGTTSTRSLEMLGREPELKEYQGWCDLYIRPGHKFQIVQGMLTNFHLPKSSLFILISAFLGRETALRIYREAIAQKYRFYSYGDACLFL